jgi:hypothetical protein
MEDLPVVRKIGDIIRVHRAIVKDHRGIKQFQVNITSNSSWCLFHSSDILLKDKKLNPSSEQDAALADQYSSSESDQEMESEMADGTTKSDRNIEKSEKKRYTPYKFSGKSYSFDYH